MPSSQAKLSGHLQVYLGMVAASLVACSGTSMRPATTAPPTLDDVRNATVVGLFDEPVTLRDGRWEGEPYVTGGASRPTAGVIGDLSVAGDLDGDGIAELVTFLWSATGGSGTRTHIAVFSSSGRSLSNRSTAPIGDRVRLREARIANDRIEVVVVQHGPGDAMCCPSVEATRVWLYDGRHLRESPHEGH